MPLIAFILLTYCNFSLNILINFWIRLIRAFWSLGFILLFYSISTSCYYETTSLIIDLYYLLSFLCFHSNALYTHLFFTLILIGLSIFLVSENAQFNQKDIGKSFAERLYFFLKRSLISTLAISHSLKLVSTSFHLVVLSRFSKDLSGTLKDRLRFANIQVYFELKPRSDNQT